ERLEQRAAQGEHPAEHPHERGADQQGDEAEDHELHDFLQGALHGGSIARASRTPGADGPGHGASRPCPRARRGRTRRAPGAPVDCRMSDPPLTRDGAVELAVERMVHGGLALARKPSGEIALVAGALPGERVLARVEPKRGVWMGRTLQVLEAAPGRVAAPAHPGLDYGFAAYPLQPELKREGIADSPRRAPGGERAGSPGRPAPPASGHRSGAPAASATAAPAATTWWCWARTPPPAPRSTRRGARPSSCAPTWRWARASW